LGLGLGFARMSLCARDSTGELDTESMGEVGEDAILAGVESRLRCQAFLIWFGLQGRRLAYSRHNLGAEYAGYILTNPPFIYHLLVGLTTT
jgi:hypothetical protein